MGLKLKKLIGASKKAVKVAGQTVGNIAEVSKDSLKATQDLVTLDFKGMTKNFMNAGLDSAAVFGLGPNAKEAGMDSMPALPTNTPKSQEQVDAEARTDALAKMRAQRQLTPGRSQISTRNRQVLNMRSLSNKNLLTG